MDTYKNIDDTLNVLAKKDIPYDIDLEVRHFYPPNWRHPPNPNTKVVYIQPWEFSRVPFEWIYKFETFAAGVIVPSTWTREIFLDAGLPPTKITAIPNGYDPSVFNKHNERRTGSFTFLYVGCNQYRKGLDILLKSWEIVRNHKSKPRLIIKDSPHIYGKNNLKDSLKNVSNVTVLNNEFTTEQIANLYKSCNVLVHPYRGEGFGMHICEAMACGTIPLVSDKGATDDFVTDSFSKINVDKKIVDLTKIFAGKPGDSFSNMGAHAWVNEPCVPDMIAKMNYLMDNNVTVTTNKIKTWDEIGLNYYEAFVNIMTQ